VLTTDEQRAAEMATRRVLEAGYGRVGLVCVGWGEQIDEVRRAVLPSNPAYRGYRDVLHEMGLGEEAVVGVRPALSNEWQQVGERAIGRFLDEMDEVPDGFICQGDFRAAPLMRVLRRRGIQVPQDAGVVGMANTPWCEMLDPRLTSVSLGEDQIARLAIMLTREPPPETQSVMRIQPRLIERESAAPAPQKQGVAGEECRV
jgi:DNA-binding LacI/PurR family transcriptional regulator